MHQKRVLTILNLFIVAFLFGCGTTEPNTDFMDNKETKEIEQRTEEQEIHEEIQPTDETDDHDRGKFEERVGATTEKQNSESGSDSASSSIDGLLHAHFIDVGQADATLITLSHDDKNYAMLIDAGNWNQSDVTTYLQSQSIENIDILVGTHEHADHIGQMDDVINHFQVEEVWMSGGIATSNTFERVMTAIEQSDVSYDEPRTGDVYDLGPVTIEILHPSTLQNDPNNNSISMKLTYGNVSFILTGDAYQSDEQSMINQGFQLDADVLKLGHHGSNTSTSTAFLTAVSPKIAIYSAGAENSYGHPHGEVIDRVNSHGINLYGTDVHGTIIVETDGNGINVSTNKDGKVNPGTTSTSNDFVSNREKENNNNSASKASEAPEDCIDINTASIDDLQEIIHIGPARAEDIIQLRPFDSVDALTRVNGIAAGRLQDIKNQELACTGG
ncbi:beta-lactamase superfamily II metal-dependent hydrolase [Natronobacillus azotifigens]|uniref:MBL fold metallo-hydrolase n=1 Tax=Natronobacillus azotifigens TaxID=472978 RepID=A0A9J6RFA2_9BACI|nr:MBL fold metallo-hydrolase [Natronobacillus azotifigens]MCZ0704434.1 MBL fold metallo-hydrolase [Natronobacillus azotifigens]